MRILKTTALTLLVMVFVSTAAFAAGDKAGYAAKKGMEGRLFCKIKTMMVHQDELGLSEEQIKKIEALKFATKRELIRKKADIAMARVEICQKMSGDKIDIPEVESLVDLKYGYKSEKAKALVKSCANLRDILTVEQMKKFKKIWWASRKK
ncbi:MAG: hypothetical protein GF392_04790 [Candidatus Omnitrophica bacterium]|nr:hypothetical protein [Candidatus Omnitrophota bacterium]